MAHPIIEAGIKTGKVLKSAQTLPQKQAANRYRQLFNRMVEAHNRPVSNEDIAIGAFLCLMAVVGVIVTLSAVKSGLID